jgi:hypothetical protein
VVGNRRPGAGSGFVRSNDSQRPTGAVDDKSRHRPDLDSGVASTQEGGGTDRVCRECASTGADGRHHTPSRATPARVFGISPAWLAPIGVSWAQWQQSVQHPDPDPPQQSHRHHRQHSEALKLF